MFLALWQRWLCSIAFFLASCQAERETPSPTMSGGPVPPAIELQDAQHLSLIPEPGGYRCQIEGTFDDAQADLSYRLRTAEPIAAGDVRLPVRRMVCLSSTHLGFLEELGALDVLVAVTSRRHIANPIVRKRIDSGEVAEVGEGAQLDVERIMGLKPDVVLVFGVTTAELGVFDPIRSAGAAVVVCADYMESTPLARAEWMRFFGLLLGKEELADSRLGEIRARYLALAQKAKTATRKPTVVLNAGFQGIWYMAGGQSYMAKFLEDAGASYLWADDDSTRVLRLDFETVLSRAKDADFWLNVGFWSSLAEGKANDERYTLFHAFRAGQVYNHKTGDEGGSDFYERGAARPDWVLEDLVHIFHPGLLPDHQPRWYKRLPPE